MVLQESPVQYKGSSNNRFRKDDFPKWANVKDGEQEIEDVAIYYSHYS
jgi:hypothetical protein